MNALSTLIASLQAAVAQFATDYAALQSQNASLQSQLAAAQGAAVSQAQLDRPTGRLVGRQRCQPRHRACAGRIDARRRLNHERRAARGRRGALDGARRQALISSP